MEFMSYRFDAKTCTTTCRQRLRRGGDLAYLKRLDKRQQRRERKALDTDANAIALTRALRARYRRERDERRQQRVEKAKREHQRIVAEIVGRAHIEDQRKKREQFMRKTISTVLMLFVSERRNDMSAQAMVDFMTANKFPAMEEFTVEAVTEALEWMKAEGHYDRLVAKGEAQQD
jgi:hypothetical protein